MARWKIHLSQMREHSLREETAAVKMQSFIRAKCCVIPFVTLKQHAIRIQARWRSCSSRQRFLRTKAKILSSQSAIRTHLARKRFKSAKNAAVVIQRFIHSKILCKAYSMSNRSHRVVCVNHRDITENASAIQVSYTLNRSTLTNYKASSISGSNQIQNRQAQIFLENINMR